jgi:hypothetical protein
MLATNVFGLAEVEEFEIRLLKFSTKFNRISKVQFSTSVPILANPCCKEVSDI